MDAELKNFLTRIYAGPEVLDRLATTGAKTLEEAWARANARDLVWAVTRPGVMSDDQRRRFLSEAVLAPIEHLLTDARSLNILQKLRANEQITDADRLSAADAADADASDAAQAAAARAAWSAAQATAERASDAAAYAAAAEASAAEYAADAADAARAAQAKWIRENIKLSDLHIN